MPGWLDRLKGKKPRSTKPKPPSADEAKTIRISPRTLPPENLPSESEESKRAMPGLDEAKLESSRGSTPPSDESKTVVMSRAASRDPNPPVQEAGAPARPSERGTPEGGAQPGDTPTVVIKVADEARRLSRESAPPVVPARTGPQDGPAPTEAPDASQAREQAFAQARDRLNKVQEKINKIAEEFAEGQVNRAQFQELFDHYQRERRTILTWIETALDVPNWRELAAEGRSMIIRRQHKARVLGYAICEQQSGLPLRSIGEFEADPELVVPMLTSYRSATQEIFGGGMRSTEIEGGRWLCFVTGEFALLMVLFSNEPARKDLEGLDELLRTFERMNRYILRRQPINPDELFLPYRFYIDTPK